MSWFCLNLFGSQPDSTWLSLVLDWSSLGCSSLGGGETLVFAACFEKEPKNQLKESGKRGLVRHKVVELLTLLRTINAAVPDTFFFTPPHPLPLLLLLTSLIWNPSRSSGRRGRTYQLVMYSQCREKREGRLSYVWNTPVEASGACFSSLVESFMHHSTRVLLLNPPSVHPPFLSKHGAVLLFLLM